MDPKMSEEWEEILNWVLLEHKNSFFSILKKQKKLKQIENKSEWVFKKH